MHTLPRLLTLILFGSLLTFTTARATTCADDLGRTGAIRLFPWPRPVPAMIEALRRSAADPRWTNHPQLREALAQDSSPDRVIASLFRPATLADVRAHYGPGATPPPPDHPLTQDRYGLRALLAQTLVHIEDEDRQIEWMEYLGYDLASAVQFNVSRTALTWPDLAARDRFVEHGNHATWLAALKSPEAVSPRMRWRVIRHFDNVFRRVDEDVVRALQTFPEHAMLNAWYRDQVSSAQLSLILRDYDSAWRGEMRTTTFGPVSRHQRSAHTHGAVLASLGSQELKRKWSEEFERLSQAPTALGDFASEVLIWSRLIDIIQDFAPRTNDRAVALVRLREAARGDDCRIAWATAELDDELFRFAAGGVITKRVNWRAEDLAAFERGLEPAN